MQSYNMFEQQIPVAGKNYFLIYHLAECRRESNEQRELKTGTTMHVNFATTSKKRSAGQYSAATSVVLDVVLAGKEASSGTPARRKTRIRNPPFLFGMPSNKICATEKACRFCFWQAGVCVLWHARGLICRSDPRLAAVEVPDFEVPVNIKVKDFTLFDN